MGRWFARSAIVVASVVALAACGSTPDRRYTSTSPPPQKKVQPSPKKAPPKAKAARPAPRPSPGTYIVQKGDTVYALSRRYGVTPKSIIATNRLRPPHHLEVGQRLVIPKTRTHTVVRGDTVYSISRRYGVDMSELTRLNGIGAPFTISVGQTLQLPPQTRAPVVVAAAKPKKASGRKAAPKPPTPPPPPLSGNGFVWPARGTVISRYGPKQGGRHNDGINIRLRKGADIRAAEAGTVVYAGNELKGFGNLVLVRHSGGWVSAYGHTDAIRVSRGQKVTRGQVIATAGASGSVNEPQLHFELRKGTRAVDPQKYLPPA